MLEWSEPLAGCWRPRRVWGVAGFGAQPRARGRTPSGHGRDVNRRVLERPRLLGTRGLCGPDTPRQRGLLRRWLRTWVWVAFPCSSVARSSAKSLSDMVMSSALGRVRFWTRLRES